MAADASAPDAPAADTATADAPTTDTADSPTPNTPTNWWQDGLTATEVGQLRTQWGNNVIPHKPPPSDFHFLVAQFKNPLVLVLVAAMAMTFVLNEMADAIVIGLAVGVNTILGFIQERKAYRTLESLKSVLSPQAWVLRDGQKQHLDAVELVPGDVLLIHPGDKVSADGVMLESNDCWINEAVVTGESSPVEKHVYSEFPDQIDSLHQAMSFARQQETIPERQRGWMGSIVSSGTASVLVTHTGADTMLGDISTQVTQQSEEATPLERKLSHLARVLTLIVIAMSVIIFAVGLANNRDPLEMFTTAVAVAVAAIPEGLIVSLTAILALGMYRILQRKAVVRRLMAAETLGSVTTVCLDKTGTLTEGRLRVVETNFSDDKQAQLAAILANDRRDPLDIARWDWAAKLFDEQGRPYVQPDDYLKQHQNDIELVPFSLERRLVAARSGDAVYLVGAPEDIMAHCQLNQTRQTQITDAIHGWANQGRRIIAFAHLHCAESGANAGGDGVDVGDGGSPDHRQARQALAQLKQSGQNSPPQSQQFEWLGLMAFVDPIRPGILSALEQSRAAGIRPIVITGDYAPTARAVMTQLGLHVDDDQVVTGGELARLNDTELRERLSLARLFARIKPSQKLRIIKALQHQRQVVGMMGDGVNDAPALSAADVGIAVDTATEVAQEAADLVLLNQNFSTILAAIEEGRAIFQNLRKIVLFLLSDTFSELIVILGGILLGLPLPLTAAQILWVNLIGDGFPNLALTLDPKDDDLLTQPPVAESSSIIDMEIALLIGLFSTVTGGSLLAIFWWLQPQIGTTAAQSVVFVTLSLDSLLYVFSSRSLRRSVIHDPPWRNWWLVAASGVGVLLVLAALYTPLLQTILRVEPLTKMGWLIAISASLGVVILIEAVKLLFHFWRPPAGTRNQLKTETQPPMKTRRQAEVPNQAVA